MKLLRSQNTSHNEIHSILVTCKLVTVQIETYTNTVCEAFTFTEYCKVMQV